MSSRQPATATAYTGRVTNWWVVAGCAGAAAVFAVLWAVLNAHPAGLLIGAGVLVLVTLTMTSVRTAVGPVAVVVRYGLLGWPRFRFRAEDVDRAEAISLSPARMGGWGIHWSPWRGTRLTIRSGPTLQLWLRSGRQVAVSVPDAQAALVPLRRVAD